MTGFTGSPRLVKGAIVGIDLFNPLSSVVIFQYNPSTISRTLRPKTEGGRAESTRLSGPPEETFNVDVEIDATDQLEKAEGIAVGTGIIPQIAALEMLVYPKSAQVIANTVLLAVGSIEVTPPVAPLTLFIWGPQRVLPVKLTQLTISEEAYDVKLNPIRAKVTLGVRVLTYDDLPMTHPGYGIFLAHQVVKETMAVIGSAQNLGDLAGGQV